MFGNDLAELVDGLRRLLCLLAIGATIGAILGGYELVRACFWIYRHVSIN